MRQTEHDEVFEDRRRIYTINLVKGKAVYGEKLVKDKGLEFREWDARRSKLGAAIMKGAKDIGIKKGSTVLYLGASSGTTSSHVSDIVGEKGFVFALDFAPRMVKDLYFLCIDRDNMTPLLEDANRPETYMHKVSSVDMVFMDIAQRNQAEIFLKNTDMFLKKGGIAMLALKARSIDVTKPPRQIYEMVKKQLEEKIQIIEQLSLEPYEKDHMMFICRKVR